MNAGSESASTPARGAAVTRPDPPLEQARRRHAEWDKAATALQTRVRRISDARLLVFAAGLVFCLWIMKSHPKAWGWLLPPVALFAGLVVVHGGARRRSTRAAATRDVYSRSILRMTDEWHDTGLTGEQLLPHEPLFARDLDLFGHGSLYQLVATSGTRLGQVTLARWLSEPAAAEEVGLRQVAVRELVPALDLREQLAVDAGEPEAAFDRESLLAWAATHDDVPAAWTQRAGDGLALLGIAATLGWAVGVWPFFPLGLVVVADLLLGQLVRGPLSRLQAGLATAAPLLAALKQLIERLEAASWQAPRLTQLQSGMTDGGRPASQHIRRLSQLVDHLHSSQRNPLHVMLAVLLHTPLRTAHALHAWRTEHAPSLPRWLDATGELEALAALATHAWEHPAHVFPDVCDGPPRFIASDLGHPLLPVGRCVTNDLQLDADLRLLLLSGSNMSGKSTLMRAVGLNALLAMAGAPVRATALECTPFALATSMRVEDSLQEGTSRFLAEIRRLQAIDALTRRPQPVLYLLDEILHGTNSSDRLAGSRAVIRRFFERGALGLVSTHDLALTAIADELAPAARNTHLRESFEHGVMVFDYKLRDGVVTRGNALDLMRSLGLDV